MTSRIEAWLKEKIGLDVTSLGSGAIAVAVRMRMAACKVDLPKEYEALLISSEAEGRELIEAVVVPETWFFRDKAAFAYLAEWAKSDWFPHHPRSGMKILSMPCSTGEEPLSVAMTLLKAGIQRFQVEGVDISEKALAVARAGVYGRNSFRGSNAAEREAFFSPTPIGHGKKGWKIRDEVKLHLLYRQENLLGTLWNFSKARYDVIFCRNLLIYLDANAQKLLLERIAEALHPEGLLFVGHSESYLVSKFGFVSAGASQAFGFRKKGAARRSTLVEEKRGGSAMPVLKRVAPLMIPELPKLPEAAEALDEEGVLRDCERLANSGQLSRASEKLSVYLIANQFSVRAHFLMGVIRDAEGQREEANAHYRKALYLDPGHEEALMHLRLHARHQGDLRGEEILSRRLERLILDPPNARSDGGKVKSRRERASQLNFIPNQA